MRYTIRKALRSVLIPIVCILATATVCLGQHRDPTHREQNSRQLKHRWFFSFGYGRNRKGVEDIESLIDVGADHGLNGMVLSSFGLDSITRWKERDVALLKELAAYCEKKQIELIPTGLSVGYGGGALGHDRSFAAALPATVSLKAEGGRIVPAPSANLLKNGDLEEHTNNRFKGYGFHDQPGEISFVDSRANSGKSSIRFENFGASERGHGRINQKVTVTPGRMYRLTLKIRTEDLQPVSGLKAMVYADGRSLTDMHPNVKTTQDWTETSLDYVNKGEESVIIYIGIWGGKSGKFWLDDLKFCEYADLSDIPRGQGTPLSLRSKDRDKVFVEGNDFGEIRCLRQLKFVRIPRASSIKEGEELVLSCYKIPGVHHSWGKQVSLCMSNPELYAYWEQQAKELHRMITFKKFLLDMDEIRNGGGCELCHQSGKSMAEILGECITKQHKILKRLDPEMEVLIWSDMLDPNHYAHDNYYGVVGDFTDSWKHVPKDLIMMCWYHKIRDKSLGFFSERGFRTSGAAYYDADDLTNPRQWLSSLRRTRTAQGIMYTTWEKKYRLLPGFGNLVSGTTAEQ